MPRVLIVIPCFNEATRLNTVAFRGLAAEGHQVELCFVDDGSTDGTFAILDELVSRSPDTISVLRLEQNSGKAEAVRRGFLAALERRPDYIGFWDADLATPLNELPRFCEVFDKRPETQIVFGARVRLLGREIVRRPARHYIGRVGATLISSTLGIAVYDTQCGAKLFRVTEDLAGVFSRPFLSRWIFDVEILARFIELWGRARTIRSVCELPLLAWHDVRGSKVGSGDFLRALKDLWRIRRSYQLRS